MKHKALALLVTGMTVAQVHEELDVPMATVYNWNVQRLRNEEKVKIKQLQNSSVASLEVINEKAKESAPHLAKDIDGLIKGVMGLQQLEPAFHATMFKAINRADRFLDRVDADGNSDLTVTEWTNIVGALSKAYASIFNTSGTTVNMVNNNAGNESVAFFKASKHA